MDQMPSWLIDAVAAAGLATVYADEFDAIVELGPRKAEPPTPGSAAH